MGLGFRGFEGLSRFLQTFYRDLGFWVTEFGVVTASE